MGLLQGMILFWGCEKPLPQSTFPVIALYGPDANPLAKARFFMLRQAGFNRAFNDFGRKENLNALNVADSTGLRLYLNDSRLTRFIEGRDSSWMSLDSVVFKYATHRAFAGYYPIHAPSVNLYPRLSLLIDSLKQKDPSHPVLVTFPSPLEDMAGSEGFESYLHAALDSLGPSQYACMYFPIQDFGLRDDYFVTLEMLRRISDSHRIPFLTTCLTASFSVYPEPLISHLRFQIFCGLAFGAKGLIFYPYSLAESDLSDAEFGMVDTRGRPTDVYSSVRSLNHNLAPIYRLMPSLDLLTVFHSDVDTLQSAARYQVPIDHVEGSPLLVSLFKDSDRRSYLLLVNKDHQRGAKARIYFNESVKVLSEINGNRRKPLSKEMGTGGYPHSMELIFRAGSGRLFCIDR
jgi:hypothetical protein